MTMQDARHRQGSRHKVAALYWDFETFDQNDKGTLPDQNKDKDKY